MGNACIGFSMDDAAQAWEHMQTEIVKDYGDYAYGHLLLGKQGGGVIRWTSERSAN